MPGLRIALVTTFYPPFHFGGDAIFLRRLAHGLVRRGHNVEVIHDVDAFKLLHRGEMPQPAVEPEGVVTHPLQSHWGSMSCLATQQTGRPVVHGRRIRQILEHGRFDVIHFHNISLVGGPGILDFGTAIKLYMAHEHWLVCPSHVLWRHNRELCTGRQCLRCVMHYGRPPQLWRYTGLLERKVRAIDAFISPSAFSADKHQEFGFSRRLEVIPYFLPDLDSGAESEEYHGEGERSRPYFLFVGRLEKIKGLQDVLPSFYDNPPADLVVVGTGEYEAELRQQARHSAHIVFLGSKTPEQLRQLYRGALAVIVPSVCFETFGIVVLEAFRDRTPVIVRNLGPLPEIVRDSGGGLVFETRDELSAAIRQFAQDPAARQEMADAGHQALQNRWVESVVIEQYFDLIRRLAVERGAARVLEELGPAVGGRIAAASTQPTNQTGGLH